MSQKPIELLRELSEQAHMHGDSVISSSRSDGWRLQDYIKKGEPIPDHLLPGRMIMNLTNEQREVLKGLSSNDTEKERIDYTHKMYSKYEATYDQHIRWWRQSQSENKI